MCLVRKQAGVQESLGLVSGIPWTEDLLSSCGNPASYQFSTFRLGCVLPQMAHITLCKTSLDQDLVLADCVRFWPNGSGPEVKPVCETHPAHFWPMLLSRSGPDANPYLACFVGIGGDCTGLGINKLWLHTVLVPDVCSHRPAERETM